MKNKKSLIIIGISFSLVAISILSLNILKTTGVTPFNPPPDEPNDQVVWDFDNDTMIGWKREVYWGSELVEEMDYIFNISAMPFFRNYPGIWINGWGVQLTSMYFNTTTNSLEKDLDLGVFNYSLVNFTDSTAGTIGKFIGIPDSSSPIVIAPFIPKNSSAGLMMQWCAERLVTSYEYYLDDSNPDIIVEGNTMRFDNSMGSGEYVEAIYYDNGTLKTAQAFSYQLYPPFGITVNHSRIYNFNPLDELEWNVDIGDVFYTGMMGGELQYNITGFVNNTYTSMEAGLPIYAQEVLANVSLWNYTTNIWELFDVNVTIGIANDIAPILIEPMMMIGTTPLIVPKDTTGKDVAEAFSPMTYYYPEIEIIYGDYWAKLINTTVGGEAFLEFFPDGLVKYIYTISCLSPEDMVIFYKNNATISDDHDFEIEPYGTVEFSIHVNISVSDDTHLLFAGMHLNPTNISLDDGLLFIDLFVNDTKNLVGLVNITINYDSSKYGYLKTWHFNMTADGGKGAWEEIPFTIVDTDIIMISADNLSFFALSAVPYPGAFTLYTDAKDPDTDGKFKLWWDASSDADSYSIYKSNIPITTLTGNETLVKSGIISLEESITETINGTYYYVVVAINEASQILSNYVDVEVQISPEPEEGEEEEEEEEEPSNGVIPGYPLFFVLTLFTVISSILIRKHRKK